MSYPYKDHLSQSFAHKVLQGKVFEFQHFDLLIFFKHYFNPYQSLTHYRINCLIHHQCCFRFAKSDLDGFRMESNFYATLILCLLNGCSNRLGFEFGLLHVFYFCFLEQLSNQSPKEFCDQDRYHHHMKYLHRRPYHLQRMTQKFDNF